MPQDNFTYEMELIMQEKIKSYAEKAKKYLIANKNVAGIIAGVVFIIIVIILIAAGTSGEGKSKSDETTEAETTVVIVKPTEDTETNTLVPLEESSKIVEVIEKYYDAKASADIEALADCVDNMEGISENAISNYGKYIEEYQDIVCYKIDENSNICKGVVFVTFKYKYTGIETPAPGYSYMQVIEDADGNYKIHNMLTKYEMEKLEQFLGSFSPESALKVLENQIDEEFKQVYESDEDLQKLYDAIQN